MENLQIKRPMPVIEDFDKTVKSADLKDLKPLKDELYAYNQENIEEYKKRSGQLYEWSRLLKKLNPDCQKTRLYHFVIGSSLPKGVSEADDLEGEFSAEAFLRGKEYERDEIIKKLQHQEALVDEGETISA